MKILFPLLLALCLMAPAPTRAGGDMGKDRDALRQQRHSRDLGGPPARRVVTVRKAKTVPAKLNKTAQAKINAKSVRSPGLLEQGKILFKKGKYREAELVLLQAAAKDDSKPETHFFLGEVYLALEAYDKAESEYKKAKGYY